MCFGSDQFLERAHMKTESIEVTALKPLPAAHPLESRCRAEPMHADSVKNANRAKQERKSKTKQQQITKQQSPEGETMAKRDIN